jgi:mannose-6-phosphate isomerase
MPKLDSPLQLQPVFKPKLWGRKNLDPLFSQAGGPARRGDARRFAPPRPYPATKEPIGEVWITDETAAFLNGPVAGLTLREASWKYGPELHGQAWKDPHFPILAKYLFTGDWLSVQVHPDDDYARIHNPGNSGKCEMWYFIHADRRGEALLGLKPGIHKNRLRTALEAGTSRKLLNRFHPRKNEAAFVPPGTIHALGPGLVLFEAEQNSDLTYRLDAFGRVGLDGKPRPLHLEKGLAVIQPDQPARRNLPRLEFRESYGWRRLVLACPFFSVVELTLRKLASFEG